jgi:hypothetical protein
MREKVLEFMNHTMTGVDETIEAYVADCRRTFSESGKSEAELDELISAIDKSLKQERDNILNDAVDVISAQLTEEQLDAANAFYRTPVYENIKAATPIIQDNLRTSTSKWLNTAMTRVEPLMTKMFGAPEPATIMADNGVPAAEMTGAMLGDDEPTIA